MTYPGAIYTREQEYAQGCSDGAFAAGVALELGLGVTHEDLADAREAAALAQSRMDRTYWIGYLRGYRDAVRTQDRKGRWGT